MTAILGRKFVPSFLSIVLATTAMALTSGAARAAEPALPPQAAQALDEIYGGNPDAGIVTARSLEEAEPRNPLGYTIEAEGMWWKIYCESCEIQWGMVDAWKGGKGREADAYLALAAKVIKLSNDRLSKSDTAAMHLYAGIGWALEARLYGLRGDHRKTAHAGVQARAECLRALRLDPGMADAEVGVGLYNYYVDTLSPMLKVLRIFMGIPGGSKKDGFRQLQNGIDHGVLLPVDARFYLAKDLRTYDHQYQQALTFAEPLAVRYPHNPIFLSLVGNLNAELGRKETAGKYFEAALSAPLGNAACDERVRKIASSFLQKTGK
ncbi:MAG TPA: hypothetical protein VNK23_11580 [Candidatus Dormibacteraeota bacterium]|nr:hypothetical protein [Candidatus Dormibacteraeota bacterium]